MEKNLSVFFFLIIAGILILNPITIEVPQSFGEENEFDTEVTVGRALELSFLLAKEPEPNEVQISFEIKKGNQETEISTISFKKDTEEISFEKNKYFETAYADFYFDEESIEVVFQIYFARALEITGFTVTAIDLEGDSSEIFVDKSINVKRANKSIALHSIAEYEFQDSLIRERLLSTEYIISPNPNGEGDLHVIDGGLNDEDGENNGSIILTQIPTGLYSIVLEKNEIVGPHEISLTSLEPPKILNVGVHSFNPTLTTVFREPIGTGLEEPEIVDANFGEEFDELLEADACIVDSITGECIPISDPNDLTFAIVGDQNLEGINEVEAIQIQIDDEVIPDDDDVFSIIEAEQFLPTIETPDPELNQATLLPTLSVFDEKTDSLYAFSSGVKPQDMQDNAIIVKIGEDSFDEGRGGVQQAIIRGSPDLEIPSGENKPEVFSFKNNDSPGTLLDGTPIPRIPSIDNFLQTDDEDRFETYIDVQTRYEQGDSNAVNWHLPSNFETPPTIRIVIPAISHEIAYTNTQSGFEVFSMDSNDDMYLIPKPNIFMLDETVSPPEWIQKDVKIFHETCERISESHAICDAEIPHYSKFAIGGVKSLALGKLIISKHSDKNIAIEQSNQTIPEIGTISGTSDQQLNEQIEEQITNDISTTPQQTNENEFVTIKIPNWLKQTSYWWISGLISDSEFKSSVQFLNDKHVIEITQEQDAEESHDMTWVKTEFWDWTDGFAEENQFREAISLLIRDEV